MADGDKPQKINLGFQGGPALSVRATPGEVRRLRDALGSGGWFDLNAEDGAVALDLSRVVYVMTDADTQRVGFSS